MTNVAAFNPPRQASNSTGHALSPIPVLPIVSPTPNGVEGINRDTPALVEGEPDGEADGEGEEEVVEDGQGVLVENVPLNEQDSDWPPPGKHTFH